MAIAGCGSQAQASGSETVASTAASTTAAGFKKARWGKNVTVTYGRSKVRVRSNGIPNHSRQYWSLVQSIAPDYKTLRNWLKINGHLLSLD